MSRAATRIREIRNNPAMGLKPSELREHREMLRLTQAELATMLGYGSKSRIAELEAGKRKPGQAVLRLLHAYIAGYRPIDWPKRETVSIGRLRKDETIPMGPLKLTPGIVAMPPNPEAVAKVRKALQAGMTKPRDVVRRTGLGLLTVKEAMEAIASTGKRG